MANCTCRPGGRRDPERSRAEAAAQAIIAQGRQVARGMVAGAPASPVRAAERAAEEPMHRYVHHIPVANVSPTAAPAADPGTQACLERITELLTCQNQLLIDLLGAVNSLTAASISAQCRQ